MSSTGTPTDRDADAPADGPGSDRTGSDAAGNDAVAGAVAAATPDGPPYPCPYCDRRFTRADWLALHEGLAHEEQLDGVERDAVAAAREAEREALRLFRLKALGALVLLYFGFLVLYALVLGPR